jgi:hypothetical protein
MSTAISSLLPGSVYLEILSFHNEVLWKINLEQDSPIYQMRSRPSVLLIHPAIYSKLIRDFDLREELKASCLAASQDSTYISTNLIVFGFSTELDWNKNTVNPQYCESLFTQLRLVSGNTKIPRFWHEMQFDIATSFPAMPKFGQKLPEARYVSPGELDTAIRWQNIPEIDENIISNRVPIHQMLLFEAVSAIDESDYRKGVLFAAISLESAISTAIELAYSRARKGEEINGGRIQANYANKNEREDEKRDPILDRLIQTARFQDQLHEVALYALGRSMLFDNKALYDSCLKLYKTRNKIAHTGDAAEGNANLLSLDYSGASIAVATASATFHWLQIQSGIVTSKDSAFKLDQFAPQWK